jgi:hypothetical protein
MLRSVADGFARTYNVELICSRVPTISKAELFAALRKRCPQVQPLDGDVEQGPLAFVHPDHVVQYQDKAAPAQTFIAIAAAAPKVEKLEAALSQTWDFDGARAAVEQATSTVLVSDLMASSLEPQARLRLFLNVLAAVLEVVPCEAIHWVPSGRIVGAQKFVAAFAENDAAVLASGPINVRLFNITSSPGDLVMDTLGLAALGLVDLQCHFRALEPSAVAHVLYNTAIYIFEQGDVIEDGHTVPGIAPDQRWKCLHEEALIGPKRVVLDMNPGAPFVAGAR